MKFVIHPNALKTGFNLEFIPRLEEVLEVKKMNEIIKFLADRFELEMESDMIEFGMPPSYKFKTKNGVDITVALDDHFGLTIDASNKKFLQGLIPLLEKEIFSAEKHPT